MDPTSRARRQPRRTPTPPSRGGDGVVLTDGSLRLGVGPGALRVHGWDVGDDAAELVGLLARPSGEAPQGGVEVVGHGALADRLRAGLGGGAEGRPVLQVLVSQRVVASEDLLAPVTGPVLPVVAQDRRIVVGPLVRPGSGPCLWCLDRHRADGDPAWGEVHHRWGQPLAQLDEVPHGAELRQLAVALVTVVARSAVAGQGLPAGLALEVGEPPPHVVARTWTAHPACRRHRGGA